LAAEAPSPKPLIHFRPAQEEYFLSSSGVLAAVWRRQYGKSYTLGCIGLDWMMETPGILVTYMSAAIRLGQENLRKEAEVWRAVMQDLRKAAAESGHKLTSNADDDHGELIDVDAIAELFEHSKLETKLWHSTVTHSRSIVIAPNPDTAVGFTGHLILDEVGRMPEFRDVWEAAEPFVASNPKFKVRMATTPPPDDTHYSYELLAPENPDQSFPVNPRGNYYHSIHGIPVHRVDAFDAAAAGTPIFDLETRKPLTPGEARAKAIDKDAWDRNFGVKFLRGGSAAIGLDELLHAMRAGADMGLGINITEEIRA
jgi:hypothetical protein